MKLAFLPALPFRLWMLLAFITLVVIFAHGIGVLAGLWAYSDDLNLACFTVFVLLFFTPLVPPPRPPMWDHRLSAADNARALLAFIEEHGDRYAPPGMVEHLRGIIDDDEQATKP